MKKIILSFLILWFAGCQKANIDQIQLEDYKDFSSAGRYHNHYLNIGLKKMKDIGGYADINTLALETSHVLKSNQPLVIKPSLHFSDIQWYRSGINLLERKQQLDLGIELLKSADKNFLHKVFEIVTQHLYDEKLYKDALVSEKKRVEGLTIPNFEKNKYFDIISIAYYSARYWLNFYELNNYANGSNNRISVPWPIDIIVQADLFGYISGYNMVMNTLEPHCQQDETCMNRHIAWARCNATTNSSLYSGTFGTPYYPSSPLMMSTTSCLSD